MLFRNDDMNDPAGKRPPVRTVPLLPLRDIIVFPHMVVPLFVGREKSIAALEEAMSHDKDILLAAQKKAKTNEPMPDDIFPVGTLGTILQLLRLPDGTVKVLVEGKKRAHIRKYAASDRFFLVEAEEVEELIERSVEIEALVRSVHSTFEAYVKLNKRIPPEMLMSVATIDDPARLADTIVAHLSLKLNDKQAILEESSSAKRLEKLYELMQGEIEILQVERKIRTRVKKQMEKTQKEYYLNEQMQAIQKELGERDEFKSELQELEEKIKNKKMSKEAITKAKKELRKLKMMSPMSAEATVVRNYIDWILSLPWYEYTKDKLDINEAEKILNDDHYGLKKPKERILEYLAVQAMVEKMKGPILCFVGPPGVGKTSLGKSLAKAMGRKFVRISLGGVRDEAEVRGHRRTYIGEVPVEFSRKGLMELIHRYTKESGVRGLEREIATLCRKVAKDVLRSGNREEKQRVTAKRVHKLLGPPRYRYGKTEDRDEIGLVTGLAWTEVGGELLQTEVTVMPGKGKLILTGKLGDVMQESAQAAMSYVRSRAERFGLDKKFIEHVDNVLRLALVLADPDAFFKKPMDGEPKVQPPLEAPGNTPHSAA